MECPLKEEEEEMKGEPLLDNRISKGGVKTLPFIIANEAFERVASFGLQPNMIFYLTRQYNMETRRATNILFLWSAAINFLPVLGAFLADSFVGRYVIIGCGCIASLSGTILLCCTTIFPALRPSPCVEVIDSCEDAKPHQLSFLYTSFALISLGAGGIRASSLAFGADQVDKGDKQSGVLQSYFSWYYIALTISYLIALTGVVYIQDHLGWTIGFGVPAVLMLLSAISFFLAAPFYVKTKANNSLLIGLVRVAVASFTHRCTNLSPQATNPSIYHHKKDSMFLVPTERLRFLNKVCIIRDPKNDLTPDGKASNPWSLCTVDQVEELKALIKVIPIWSTGIMISVTVNQTSIPVLQANSMDRHITPSFEIPAGSFSIFMIVTLVLWLAISDRIIYPITSKIRGKPTQIGLKMRMGIGLMCSVVAMAAWATAESVRRKVAIEQGITGDPRAVVHMSAMWLVPQYVFSGLGEAFHVIAQNEFFYTEFPKTMSSIASSLNGVGQSVATLAASFILNAVNYLTTREGKKSWVTSNINNGHYDYYFWLLAGLSVANLLYYIVCSKAYGPCNRDIIKVVKEKKYLEEKC